MFRVLALSTLAFAVPAFAGQADPSDVAGVYDGVHPHWRDTVVIAADGTYRRGNGDPGRWAFDGRTLVLAWKNWGPEILYPNGPGKFVARSNGFTLTRQVEDFPGVAGVYRGVHPHWRDEVIFAADGTYRRGNGDPGRWRLEGKRLVLAWKNWGTEKLSRVDRRTFKNPASGFTLTRIDRRSPEKRKHRKLEPRRVKRRQPAPPPRDCGTGDDPGCAESRGGKHPIDRDELEGIMSALKATGNELVRKDQAIRMLEKSLITARQFGMVIALFNNELTRMDVVRALAGRMVDPRRSLRFASTFNNSLTAAEYTELVSKLR